MIVGGFRRGIALSSPTCAFEKATPPAISADKAHRVDHLQNNIEPPWQRQKCGLSRQASASATRRIKPDISAAPHRCIVFITFLGGPGTGRLTSTFPLCLRLAGKLRRTTSKLNLPRFRLPSGALFLNPALPCFGLARRTVRTLPVEGGTESGRHQRQPRPCAISLQPTKSPTHIREHRTLILRRATWVRASRFANKRRALQSPSFCSITTSTLQTPPRSDPRQSRKTNAIISFS